MSDLVIDVRQIASYPATDTVSADDTILLQRGGLGGPYISATASAVVSSALDGPGNFLGVGELPPADAGGSQIFTGNLVVPPEGGVLWNAYIDNENQLRYWQAGPAANFGWNNDGDGFYWNTFPPGSADEAIIYGPGKAQMHLDATGMLTLYDNTVTVPRIAAADYEVVPLIQLDSKVADAMAQVSSDIFTTIAQQYLPLTGGPVSGPITLPGNATGTFQAVPLGQVNTLIANAIAEGGGSGGGGTPNAVPLAGNLGNPMTGPLILSGLATPANPNQAVPYTQIFGGFTLTSGTLTLFQNATSGNQAVTWAQWNTMNGSLQSQINALVEAEGGGTVDLSGFMPLTGGTFTGTVTLSADAFDTPTGNSLQPTSLRQVQALITSGTASFITSSALATALTPYSTTAQMTSAITAATSGVFLPLTGGSISGPINYLGSPLITEQNLSDTITSFKRFIETYQVASHTTPSGADLATVLPQDGDYWICVTANPQTAEATTEAIPGIGPAGVPLNNGDMLIWSDTLNGFERVQQSPVTLTTLEGIFLPLSGAQMTGYLPLYGAAPLSGTAGYNANYPATISQVQQLVAPLVSNTTLTTTLAGYVPANGSATSVATPLTLTSQLTLPATAGTGNQAVSYNQMGAAITNAITATGAMPLTGGTFSGNVAMGSGTTLTLAANGAANSMQPVTVLQMNAALSALTPGSPDLSGLMPISGGQFTGGVSFASGVALLVNTASTASGSMNPVPYSQLATMLAGYATTASVAGLAPIASPTFTGSVTLPAYPANTASGNQAITYNQAYALMQSAATTGGLPTTGGTMTGAITMSNAPINMSGSNATITINNATANNQPVALGQLNTTLGSYATTAQLNNFLPLAGGVTTGTVRIGNGRLLSSATSNPSVTVWDTQRSWAAGMWASTTQTLNFGSMDGSGAPSTSWATLDTSGNFVAGGTIGTNQAVWATQFTVESARTMSFYISGGYSFIDFAGGWYISFNTATGDLQYTMQSGPWTFWRASDAAFINWMGPMYAAAFTGLCDDRLKENITDATSGLKEICAISPKTYHRKNSKRGGVELGLSAQDVRNVLPLAAVATEDQDGHELNAVDLMAVVAALINAVKELDARTR